MYKDLVEELRIITVDACNICTITKYPVRFLATLYTPRTYGLYVYGEEADPYSEPILF